MRRKYPDPMQDYKSLCVAVMIFVTRVNTQRQTAFEQLCMLLAQQAELKTVL